MKNSASSEIVTVPALLSIQLKGFWSVWPVGLRVTARRQDNGLFFIEREIKDGNLSCMNQMADVPANCLTFSTPAPK